jgi:hypothetical protein
VKIKSSTKAKILRDAATLIRERGWCRGSWEDNRQQICLAEAVYRAASFQRILTGEDYPGLWMGLPCGMVVWNDTKGRTKAQVLRKLDRAAEKLEGVV